MKPIDVKSKTLWECVLPDCYLYHIGCADLCSLVVWYEGLAEYAGSSYLIIIIIASIYGRQLQY